MKSGLSDECAVRLNISSQKTIEGSIRAVSRLHNAVLGPWAALHPALPPFDSPSLFDSEVRPEPPEVPTEPRRVEVFRDHELQQLDIKIQAGADPLAPRCAERSR